MKVGRPRIQLDEDAVAAAYTSGRSINSLAVEHGVDRDVIRRIIDDAGIPRRLPVTGPDAPPGMVTSIQLQTRTGISYRQLDYWTRTGILRSESEAKPGTGNPRFYCTSEVPVAALTASLMFNGIELRRANAIARTLLSDGFAELGPFRLELPQEL